MDTFGIRSIYAMLLATALMARAPAPPAPPAPPQPPPPATGTHGDTRTETRTETLAYGSKLWVRNRNGAIQVTGWDREEVALVARIRDTRSRHIDLVVQRKGADLDIEAQTQQGSIGFTFMPRPSPRCDMTLSVPRKLLANFRTTNGTVSVSNLEGYARCEATNGDIVLRGIQGEVLADTTNGRVDAARLKARIKGGTTNGDILLEEVDGGVHMETTNGSIEARNLDGWGEGISLETTNGSIEVSLGRATGEVDAETTHGSLDIKVPNAQAVEVGRHSAHLKVPGRTQKITLETTNGSISVR